MMLKRLFALFALLTVLISSVAFATPTMAQNDVPANEAAEFCRMLDEEGVLDDPSLQITRGECVNILKGPSNENANNFIAGVCGATSVQEFTETTSKGQCIKVLRNSDIFG